MSQHGLDVQPAADQGLRPEPHDWGGRARLLPATTPRRSPSGPGFESPKAVYEPGADPASTSAAPCAPWRRLRRRRWPRMQRPRSIRGRKTDWRRRVPRKVSRNAQRRRGVGALTGAPRPPGDLLPRAGGRPRRPAGEAADVQFRLRHGHVFDERPRPAAGRETGRGRTGGGPTRSSSSSLDDAAAYEHHFSRLRAYRRERRDALARRVAESAGRPERKPAVDALRCVKGVDVATAPCSPARWATLPGSLSAPSFAPGWLRPRSTRAARHSSRGGYPRATPTSARRSSRRPGTCPCRRDPAPLAPGQRSRLAVRRHAAKYRRHRTAGDGGAGKRPVVANCATARDGVLGWR